MNSYLLHPSFPTARMLRIVRTGCGLKGVLIIIKIVKKMIHNQIVEWLLGFKIIHCS